MNTVFVHHTVGGTIHRFHTSAAAFLALEEEHIFLVVLIVPAGFPKLKVENVGSNYFVVAADTILLSDHVHKLIVDFSSVRIEECTSRRNFKMIKQVLLTPNETVVTFLSLFTEMDVLIELFLRGE